MKIKITPIVPGAVWRVSFFTKGKRESLTLYGGISDIQRYVQERYIAQGLQPQEIAIAA